MYMGLKSGFADHMADTGDTIDRSNRVFQVTGTSHKSVDSCEANNVMSSLLSRCNGPYSQLSQDEETYGIGWQPFTGTGVLNNSAPEYIFHSASSLDGVQFLGLLSWYSGGG
ncbi:unnamed protein product [Protopolystoma xenopodis]|uniref:Polycystin domain-containing protein n=1 Tax=Protopolystoma xenopodis TaxID=117903 RepID=A0A3S5CRC4_9PLAT|nr:unnamed protein product [Protopolystoma xenopodis]